MGKKCKHCGHIVTDEITICPECKNTDFEDLPKPVEVAPKPAEDASKRELPCAIDSIEDATLPKRYTW